MTISSTQIFSVKYSVLTNRLIVAAAGAGKTTRIIAESVAAVRSGEKVLVITYTEANQRELITRFEAEEYALRANFVVKGLFTFLLEDFVRPYQKCLFAERVDNINFNQSNPHKRGNFTIRNRQEILNCGNVNPLHYLSIGEARVHTTFLAKLACRITSVTGGKTVHRVAAIYNHIYVDEVQDLIGCDYGVIDAIRKLSNIKITCVGDFRQTIYETAVGTKQPKTSVQKFDKFIAMGFVPEQLSYSHRSIQAICDIADLVHENEGYERTQSMVDVIPERFENHNGVFVVKKSEVGTYLTQYQPTVLRWSTPSSRFIKDSSINKFNFGKAKGLGFDRVLILPTAKYIQYLKKGNAVFKNEKTEAVKNKLYVAMTRARYSLAFLIEDADAARIGYPIWRP